MSTSDLSAIQRIGFLTLPNYSMIALAHALEACRVANYVTGVNHHARQVLSAESRHVATRQGRSGIPRGPFCCGAAPLSAP